MAGTPITVVETQAPSIHQFLDALDMLGLGLSSEDLLGKHEQVLAMRVQHTD